MGRLSVDSLRADRRGCLECDLIGGCVGSEDLDVWSTAARTNLYVHESCVTLMLLAGIFAGARAWRMRGTRNVTRNPADPPAATSTLRWHRRAGWTAVSAATLGLATAVFVLLGMFSRAG